ncbi:Protein GPR15L [Desmophyllum pertusum]|uniref:Protein GPR15L n=1 Tax=Desmophyllum pertusum TaxID=174260 RepID=A0A9X0A758_9CNID|nr:Protein GPR15L [Desmophyllum pertusum]
MLQKCQVTRVPPKVTRVPPRLQKCHEGSNCHLGGDSSSSNLSLPVHIHLPVLCLAYWISCGCVLLHGNTSGLLGLWDGNQEKEFLLPNGAFLDTNSNQTIIHYKFGQPWATTANDSLFTYEEGKNHNSYVDVGYVPIFLDQDDLVFDNAGLGQQARDVCGDNKQCLFDIHTTGKVSIGMASKQAVELFVAVINETKTPGCIPIENRLQNGSVQRNDSKDGGMVYKFRCNSGFRLNGPTVIHCYQGQWNGSKPSCESSADNSTPWYVYAVVISSAIVVVIVAVMIISVRCLNSKRKRNWVVDITQPPKRRDVLSCDNGGGDYLTENQELNVVEI